MINKQEQIQNLVKEIKKQGYNNVIFFDPSYAICGSTKVESGIAKYLSKHTDLNIYFYDFKGGYSDVFFNNESNVKKINYKNTDTHLPVNEKSIFFTNTTRCILLQNQHQKNKMVFWHYETTPCAWNDVLIDNEVDRYLNLLKRENAICYHDWSAKNSLNRFKKLNLVNKDYIHIVIEKKEKQAKSDVINKNEINIGFLSRLAPDKIHGLFNLIKNYAKLKTSKKKRLHIVGDGYSRKVVEQFIENYKNEIEFILTGTLKQNELDNYLIDNVDCLFGVGTCILEGAALKIPSAVLMLDIDFFEDDDSFWLYNSKEYCVGIMQQQKNDFNTEYEKINEMILKTSTTEGKTDIGNKCYKYFIDNHSCYEDLVINFLNIAVNSTLTFKKVKKCIKYVPYCLVRFLNIKILNIGLIKIIKHLDKIRYYFAGIHIATIIRKKPYDFPAVQFKN